MECGPGRFTGRTPMKRFIFLAILSSGLISSWAAPTRSDTPFGLGRHRRVGRIEGYWHQPTRGPLFDYSPYFAARYPQLPGAAEFLWPQTQVAPSPSPRGDTTSVSSPNSPTKPTDEGPKSQPSK